MRVPPLVARVRVRTASRSFRLWVPLFLVWLLLVALLVLLLPLVLVAVLALALAPRRWRFGAVARGGYVALCETRGTQVEVEGARRRISIALR